MTVSSHLNDVVTPSRVTSRTRHWHTVKKQWPNGRRSTKREWTAPLDDFTVEFDGITLAEYNLLIEHFDSVSGSFGQFTFTDTHDGTTYNVAYADDTLVRKAISPNVRGLYTIQIKLEGVK